MSRRISAVLAAASFILLMPLQPVVSTAAERYTLTDLTQAAAHASGKTELSAQEVHRLDCNADGEISLADLVAIARQCHDVSSTPTPAAEASSDPKADAAEAAAFPYIPDAVHAEILSCQPVLDTDGTEYEVRAVSHGGTYTITVDMSDGTIRHREMEREPDPAYNGKSISMDVAKKAVVQRIPGAASSDVVSTRRTDVLGRQAFEVHVRTNAENVFATLMAETGEIVRWSEDLVPDGPGTPPVLGTTPPSTHGLLSEEEAMRIALRRAPGASLSDVVSCDLNTHTLPAVYTVSIVYNDATYVVQVGAYDSLVLTERMDREPHLDLPSAPLTEETALQALIDMATGSKIEYPAVYERETEYGIVFDVHVDCDGRITCDATFVGETGELIFWEMESAVSHAVPDPIREIVPPR